MKRVRDGFALPTVLIASMLMMIVLMTALTASSGSKVSLDEQYYLKLAEEAAEAGAVYAQQCMQANDYIAPWSGRTLDGGDACSGNTSSTYNSERYLVSNSTMRSRWSVASIPAVTNEQFINATGYVELLRSANGSVWKTYTRQLRVRVSSEVGVTKVAFGYGSDGASSYGVFFGAITASGEVKTIGLNAFGQLGNGTTTNATQPQDFQLPDGVAVRDLYASFLSTGRALYAVTTDDKLYAAGYNAGGQLGLGHTNPVTAPQLVSTNISSEDVAFVDSNSHATYVVTKSGKVYATGVCDQGTLGTGGTCPNSTTFKLVALPAGVVVKDIVTDAKTTFVQTTDGRVYGWGTNHSGALGASPAPSPTSYTNTPIQIASTVFRNVAGSRAVKLAFDGLTLYVVRDDGSLWAMGDNSDLQINGTATTQYTAPVKMNTVTGCNGLVKDVKTDRSHIAVLFTDGHVCTAGYNGTSTLHRGWLGRNSTAARLSLGRVTGTTTYGLPSAMRAVSISVNSLYNAGGQAQQANNTFIVGNDGKVYGAGANFYGQLGNGNTTSSTIFRTMQVFGSSEPAKYVQSGMGTTVIYTGTNRVYAVGNNQNGQIGNGNTTNTTKPQASKYLNIGPPSYF